MRAEKLIYITKGSKIVLKDKAYCYTYAFFSLERPGIYLYTYAYEENERWCTYRKDYSLESWTDTDTVFDGQNLPPEEEGYICIYAKLKKDVEKVGGAETAGTDTERVTMEKAEAVSGNAALGRSGQGQNVLQEWQSVIAVSGGIEEKDALLKKERDFLSRADVQEEISKTVRTIEEKRTEDSLVFTLLADTHYVRNGNWETCAATIEAVNDCVKPDGVIHLGDLTDGILDKDTCREYSHRVLDRIIGWEKPFYLTIGNHDANYFKNNPNKLSESEQYSCYLKDIVSGNLSEGQLWYDVDFPEQRLTFLFLHSYDNEQKLRYGFPQEELDWVKKRLQRVPEDYQLVLFSHEAPLARLDYWASEVRNGEKLTELLDAWNREHDSHILAFIHGHTHADYIYRERTFPIISVGCSKIEYFEGKKPEGAVKPVRIEGEVSQELWDTMIIDTKQRKIDFVRFGAGSDRSTKEERKVKIWAHRGASGYAPENTLEAFALAQEMGADGVELDVQFTKDRQLVVIHDERIDRVSDGSGYVSDYTLEELRKFNFNRAQPSCTHADIPTLREVLELLASTPLTVNIELKTGVNFYPGIERETVKLVSEMGMGERVIYSSFNHESVMRVKEVAPGAQTGFLYCDGTLAMAAYAKAHGVTALHPALYLVKQPGFPEACRENGIRLHVWTVNDADAIEQMVQTGADAVITNYPDQAYEIIHGRKPKVTKESLLQKQAAQDAPTGADTDHNEGAEKDRRKNGLLHLAGVGYSKVRKVFVAIDRVVQRAAGKQ